MRQIHMSKFIKVQLDMKNVHGFTSPLRSNPLMVAIPLEISDSAILNASVTRPLYSMCNVFDSVYYKPPCPLVHCPLIINLQLLMKDWMRVDQRVDPSTCML